MRTYHLDSYPHLITDTPLPFTLFNTITENNTNRLASNKPTKHDQRTYI